MQCRVAVADQHLLASKGAQTAPGKLVLGGICTWLRHFAALLERAVPPSHPKPQHQDNNGPKESQQIGAGHPEKHSATQWSACRTACLLAHFEQPLDWRLVTYTRLLLPARRRHGALPPSIHLQATAAAIN